MNTLLSRRGFLRVSTLAGGGMLVAVRFGLEPPAALAATAAADADASAAEVLNAIPVVQSYTQEAREAERFHRSTQSAFATAVNRTRMRSFLVGFIITATFGALLWGLYQGTQAVLDGRITAGHLGQTVVYVIILVSSVAVLAEVYGDLLRAAGATERLMELMSVRSPIASPARPVPMPPASSCRLSRQPR